MIKKWYIVITIIFVILIGISLVGPVMSQVENPEYQVISANENIEIRRYKPMIIAETAVAGERGDSIGEGFKLLADYIFGNNTVNTKIAMTAPVQQESSRKIAMTAPVQQQASDKDWKVSFVMPAKYSMSDLPKPNNEKVKLKQVPAKEFIVIKFSGSNCDENVAEHEKQLMQYVIEHQIKTTSTPKYAFYNPPWTLPMLRRNEIMLELAQ